MPEISSISSHKKQFINEASILRLRPFPIPEIGDDESFYLYLQCQKVLYEALNHNHDEVAILYALGSHEEAIIKGSVEAVALRSNTKAGELLDRPDEKVLILVHNHPKDTSFSIEDYSEFLLDFKLKTMVVVTNSGQQFFMTKTEDYDRAGAVKALIKITVEADKNKDGKLTRSEAIHSAKEFAKVAYNYGIRIE